MSKSMHISTIYENRFSPIMQRILAPILNQHSLSSLPIFQWEQSESNPLLFSISLVCLDRKNVSKFFYEMISRWLIPGKYLSVVFQFSTHFQLIEEGDTLYTFCELGIVLDHPHEIDLAKRNFPFLEKEISMGVHSFYHAAKILEIKGLTLEDKASLIQEKIMRILGRFPKKFDYDIFSEMQHFLVTAKESFKEARAPSQITRTIFILYRFRKMLQQSVSLRPSKRHLLVKCKKSFLPTPFGVKEVVSVFLGLNFLKEHELFEERHFISALSHFIPGVRSIPHSYFTYEGQQEDQIHTFYIEVEKENGRSFTEQDLELLKNGLPDETRSKIEQLVPPIFMPRNEEEVMRNILVLNQQLKYFRDIPQIVITFDEQTDTDLSFTIVLVRILYPDSLPIRELFQKSPLSHNLSIDRVKLVGRLRRKYPKEASVLRVRLSSQAFLREDYSVDLFHARLHLVGEIEKVVGEVRDYNGGMISKQSENFMQLKKLMGPLASKHPLLLQNFFHSIFPVHLSTTLDPRLLKVLFSLLLEAIENPTESALLKSKKTSNHLFVMTKFQDLSWKEKIFSRIETLQLSSNELLSVQLQVLDSHYLGFIYFNPDKEKQQTFLEAVPEALSCYV